MTTQPQQLPRPATVANTAKRKPARPSGDPRPHLEKENGPAASGAVMRRGRRVLVDLDLYGAWLAGRGPWPRDEEQRILAPLRSRRLNRFKAQDYGD